MAELGFYKECEMYLQHWWCGLLSIRSPINITELAIFTAVFGIRLDDLPCKGYLIVITLLCCEVIGS